MSHMVILAYSSAMFALTLFYFELAMPWKFKIAWSSTAYLPSLLRLIVSRDQNRSLGQVLLDYQTNSNAYPKSDQQLAFQKEIVSQFCISELELMSRRQILQQANEFALWGHDWGFALNEIESSITSIWHGEEDTSTTFEMGKYLAQSIECPLFAFERQGHLLYFKVFDQILSWIQTGACPSVLDSVRP
jgi:hypothetical protein